MYSCLEVARRFLFRTYDYMTVTHAIVIDIPVSIVDYYQLQLRFDDDHECEHYNGCMVIVTAVKKRL